MNNNEINFDPITGKSVTQTQTNIGNINGLQDTNINTNQNNINGNQANSNIINNNQINRQIVNDSINTNTQQNMQQNIINQMQAIPTVGQDKQAFINNTQMLSTERKEEKKQGINYVFVIILFVLIFASIIFLFPFLLKRL